MAAQKRSKTINLLPQEEFTQSSVGIALSWALSVGRVIVIFTELIVIGAFLSRFFLDARITDLSDEIEAKQARIQASLEFEKNFKVIQQKLKIFSQVASSTSPVPNLDTIATLVPSDVLLNSFSFSEGDVDLQGNSLSESSLSSFVYSLKASGKFSDVTITQVTMGSQLEPGLKFTLKLTIKKGNV